MGPATSAPPPPNYELLRVPATVEDIRTANYLQALEGGIDSSHSRILHHKGADVEFLRDYRGLIPQFDLDKSDYGFVYSAKRASDDGRQWVRVSH